MGDEVLTAANSDFDCYQESLFRQDADFFPRKKSTCTGLLSDPAVVLDRVVLQSYFLRHHYVRALSDFPELLVEDTFFRASRHGENTCSKALNRA